MRDRERERVRERQGEREIEREREREREKEREIERGILNCITKVNDIINIVIIISHDNRCRAMIMTSGRPNLLTHSLTHSLSFTHSLTHSVSHSLSLSLTHSPVGRAGYIVHPQLIKESDRSGISTMLPTHTQLAAID